MAGEKIMIVDDESVVHELLAHYLEREGFKVFSVYNGSLVMEQIEFHKPDLILLDILLPGYDGLEICLELRKITDVPVIFITSKNAPMRLRWGWASAEMTILKTLRPGGGGCQGKSTASPLPEAVRKAGR